jgi:hypothetical protein
MLAAETCRITLQSERPVTQVWQQDGRDGREVDQQMTLRVRRVLGTGWPEHPLWMGDRYAMRSGVQLR